ncbi:MAG: ATP-dependent Clp protease adaptor ClpS [Firmicutes bacterium]|nr:ATP-dependent Clp protease adaptor ClpS [Bacillota bacterium]
MATQASVEAITKIERPRMFSVVLYNDDVTTVEFVIELIQTVFHRDLYTATEITMQVHNEGKAVVAGYTYDIAISKKMQAENMAQQHKFPLKIGVE